MKRNIFRSAKRRFTLYLVNRVYAGTEPKFYEKKRRLLNSIGYDIGEGTRIVGPIFCTGRLTVGKNSFIGRNLTVHGNGSVVIGDGCDLGPDVTFLTGGHKIGDATRRAGEGLILTQSVGDGSWIGARSTVVNNTSIGRGCVVAACACVTRDVPDNTLVGGVPAREIRSLADEH